MTYIDIHTHNAVVGDGLAVVNCSPADDIASMQLCSIGIHPWWVDVDENWKELLRRMEDFCCLPNVVAVGECGLDRLRGGAWQSQLDCFEAQLQLAKRFDKPVIIHCVKAWGEVMELCRDNGRCIVHGFRGGTQLAQQLLGKGFDLSFGKHFNVESLKLAYENRRMWLETDDCALSIVEVYERVSRALSISPTDIRLPGTISFSAI